MDSRAGREDKKAPTEEAKTPRCDVCLRHSFAESILSCHRCITVQHTFCLPSPLVSLPDRRKWLCPACSESSLRKYPSRRRRHSSRCSAGAEAGGEGESGGRGRSGAFSLRLRSGSPRPNGAAATSAATKSRSGATNNAAEKKQVDVVGNGTAPACPAASSTPSNKRPRRAASGNGTPPPMAVDDNDAATTAAAAGGGGGGNGAARPAAAPSGGCSEPSTCPTNGLAPSDTEREPYDPGSTITLFCRRDFRRYLRWKRRELANQDKERKREEQTRARKTFSSIIASNARR